MSSKTIVALYNLLALDITNWLYLQVAVLPEVAVQIVSALGDLYHVRVNAHAERIIDLFEKARATVFKELCSYWSGFCKVYEPPFGEVTSLPQCGLIYTKEMLTGTNYLAILHSIRLLSGGLLP